jgi:hypothetical protein
MPQVDLRPLFQPPLSKDQPARDEHSSAPTWKHLQPYVPERPSSRFELTVAQLTNVGFVLAACLGAAVSALYLVKGGEIFQEVAAWPRELFHGRPAIRAPSRMEAAPERREDDAGDPFSSTAKLLKLNSAAPSFRPNNVSSSPFAASDQALNHLNMPAPGGDALSRGLMQGAATPNAAAGGAAAHSVNPQSATTNVSSKPGSLVTNAAAQTKTASRQQTTRKSALKRSAPAQKNLKIAKQAKWSFHLGTSSNAATGNHTSISSSHMGQSAAAAHALAPIGHSFGGAAGGMGIGAGHSFGRAGGR